MAISKRLRYEVLRRDNHTCRYCGGVAPDVKLTVDHVLPTALGGTDKADNLVAACADCNAGKSSSNPDQPLVDQVSADAERWARAVRLSAQMMVKDRAEAHRYWDALDEVWSQWTHGFRNTPIPRDAHWRDSIEILRLRGMPASVIAEGAVLALSRDTVTADSKWRYFMGIMWKKLTEIEEVARQVFEAETQADE